MFIGIHRTCVGLYAAGFLDHVVLAEVGSPGFSLNKSAVILMFLSRMAPESLHPTCRSCRYGQLRNAHGNTDFVASPWKRQAGIPQRLSETRTLCPASPIAHLTDRLQENVTGKSRESMRSMRRSWPLGAEMSYDLPMALAIGLLENTATSEISATTFGGFCTSTGADPDSEVRKRLAACEA